jgi:uncharacterized protein with PIN domain
MAERFIVDRMLGRLAKWLRILGYDTLYWRGNDWRILMEKGRDRILLTRTTKFSHGGNFQGVILVREDNPDLQLRSVIKELGLKIDEHRIFSRCLICNRQLEKISPECSRIYWKGTHQESMRKKVVELSSH